jgi:hypothetical protein
VRDICGASQAAGCQPRLRRGGVRGVPGPLGERDPVLCLQQPPGRSLAAPGLRRRRWLSDSLSWKSLSRERRRRSRSLSRLPWRSLLLCRLWWRSRCLLQQDDRSITLPPATAMLTMGDRHFSRERSCTPILPVIVAIPAAAGPLVARRQRAGALPPPPSADGL